MLNQTINNTISKFDANRIAPERKAILNQVVSYAQSGIKTHGLFKLVFVCTHNSRRSQLAQVWAFAMSKRYSIPFQSFSGGVEETAFHSNSIQALRNQGFLIELDSGDNPKAIVRVESSGETLTCFSKMYDDETNPKSNFAAIMVCDHADANCPFVAGAEKRISLNYKDPKRFDGKPESIAGYEATSVEIGIEMNYIFSKLV